MKQIEREDYERWRDWETKRRDRTHGILQGAVGDALGERRVLPHYDEWLAAGKPEEQKVRLALE